MLKGVPTPLTISELNLECTPEWTPELTSKPTTNFCASDSNVCSKVRVNAVTSGHTSARRSCAHAALCATLAGSAYFPPAHRMEQAGPECVDASVEFRGVHFILLSCRRSTFSGASGPAFPWLSAGPIRWLPERCCARLSAGIGVHCVADAQRKSPVTGEARRIGEKQNWLFIEASAVHAASFGGASICGISG